MKVQNQVRVWPVGQRTSSWHITDMWDMSVSKLISIDGKEPTRRSLRETRSQNTQTGSHGGQDIFEHGGASVLLFFLIFDKVHIYSGEGRKTAAQHVMNDIDQPTMLEYILASVRARLCVLAPQASLVHD